MIPPRRARGGGRQLRGLRALEREVLAALHPAPLEDVAARQLTPAAVRPNDDDGDARAPHLRALAPTDREDLNPQQAMSGQRAGEVPVLVPTMMQFPADGQDLLAAGGSVDVTERVRFVVVRIIVDVPSEAQGRIEIDGRPYHRTEDGQGSSGVVELGDFAARAGVPAERVRVVVQNDHATDQQHVRYWLVGFAPQGA